MSAAWRVGLRAGDPVTGVRRQRGRIGQPPGQQLAEPGHGGCGLLRAAIRQRRPAPAGSLSRGAAGGRDGAAATASRPLAADAADMTNAANAPSACSSLLLMTAQHVLERVVGGVQDRGQVIGRSRRARAAVIGFISAAFPVAADTAEHHNGQATDPRRCPDLWKTPAASPQGHPRTCPGHRNQRQRKGPGHAAPGRRKPAGRAATAAPRCRRILEHIRVPAPLSAGTTCAALPSAGFAWK